MGFLRIPLCVTAWYADRFLRIRKREVVGWAIAEIICMSLSVFSLVLLILLSLLRLGGVAPPMWMSLYVLPVLIAGAVGYLTNLIAITMLFRPYGPDDKHPVGSIPGWKQGLIPKHRDELAENAGRQAADRLLTPDAIADEAKLLLQKALKDTELQAKLRRNLGPVIREKLPGVIETMTPEIMRFLRGVVAGGFTRENLVLLIDTVVDPLLTSEKNRRELADWTTANLRRVVPEVIALLQEMAKKYKNKGFWKKAALWAAEKTKVLDWEQVREVIEEKIADRSTRKEIIGSAEAILGRLRSVVQDLDAASTVKRLQEQASDFVVTIVEEHLDKALPDFGHRIADDRSFWRWLADEGLPSIQPYMIAWLEGDGLAAIKDDFDVAGRVTSAINDMDIKDVHVMINDVSARHLGAIQVLGYILGTIAGGCLLLV